MNTQNAVEMINETLFLVREPQFILDCWSRGGEKWTHDELCHYFGETPFEGAVTYANALVLMATVWADAVNRIFCRQSVQGAVEFLTNEQPHTYLSDGGVCAVDICGNVYQIGLQPDGFHVFNAGGEDVSVTSDAPQAVYEIVMMWVSGQ